MRGVQEEHRTRARQVLGPGRMKVRTLSFSVIKPKLDSVSQLPVQQLMYFQTFAWLLFYLHSDYYKNKLHKFLGGSQKLGGPVSFFLPLGKISLRDPANK